MASIRGYIAVTLGFKNLRGLDLSGLDLRKASLEGVDLTGANLERAVLKGANLQGANLTDVRLGRADLRAANLRETDLENAKLGGAKLSGADFTLADLRSADLAQLDLQGVNLHRANLTGANLASADLRDAQLGGVVAWDVCLAEADLRGANLEYANLDGSNCQGANLGRANLEHAALCEADLTGARLWDAALKGTKLGGAKLAGVKVDVAQLDRRKARVFRVAAQTEARRAVQQRTAEAQERGPQTWGELYDRAYQREASRAPDPAATDPQPRQAAPAPEDGLWVGPTLADLAEESPLRPEASQQPVAVSPLRTADMLASIRRDLDQLLHAWKAELAAARDQAHETAAAVHGQPREGTGRAASPAAQSTRPPPPPGQRHTNGRARAPVPPSSPAGRVQNRPANGREPSHLRQVDAPPDLNAHQAQRHTPYPDWVLAEQECDLDGNRIDLTTTGDGVAAQHQAGWTGASPPPPPSGHDTQEGSQVRKADGRQPWQQRADGLMARVKAAVQPDKGLRAAHTSEPRSGQKHNSTVYDLPDRPRWSVERPRPQAARPNAAAVEHARAHQAQRPRRHSRYAEPVPEQSRAMSSAKQTPSRGR